MRIVPPKSKAEIPSIPTVIIPVKEFLNMSNALIASIWMECEKKTKALANQSAISK